jgi:hypothetical protein
MGAIDLLNDGDQWTDATTRVALPIVLSRAMDGIPITYGDLNYAVHGRGEPLVMALTYRYVAGKIGDVCEALAQDLGYEVPPLNAIIVNEDSRLPSHGVNGYLATYFGMTPRQIKPDPKKFAGGPESVAHKRLKQWLAKNPVAVNSFGKFKEGEIEFCLASGDRLDVLFTNAKTRVAAEVKTSEASEDELQRGVYQCVKYRATLRAMQLAAAEPPNAQSVLVMYCRPTVIVRRLADRLSVTIIDVSADFDEGQSLKRSPLKQRPLLA